MIRAIGFIVGALGFLAAQAVESARWHDWFQGEHEPWFLNSGRSILFTIGCVGLGSVAVAALNRSNRPVRGMTIAAGAFAAMTAVLFLKEGGPGTIFPIVMVAGGVFLLLAAGLGAWIGRVLGRLMRARR